MHVKYASTQNSVCCHQQNAKTAHTDSIVNIVAAETACILIHVTRQQETVHMDVEMDGRCLCVKQVRMLK